MSVPYTIRRAVADDAETIKQMVRSAPLNPDAIDWQYFLVLEVVEQGKPVIASIGMVQPEGSIWEVDSVMTRRQYRKRGYAAAVVRALLTMEHSPRPLYLLAETALIPFYERLGFRLLEHDDSPREMREQVEWLDRMFGDRVQYHIMGIFAE